MKVPKQPEMIEILTVLNFIHGKDIANMDYGCTDHYGTLVVFSPLVSVLR